MHATVEVHQVRQVQCLDCPCCPDSPVICEWRNGRAGECGRCHRLSLDVKNAATQLQSTHLVFTWDQMTRQLDDWRWCSVEVRGSFQETASRKTAENTVKHHDGDVYLVVANHRDGGESLVVVTTLLIISCTVMAECLRLQNTPTESSWTRQYAGVMIFDTCIYEKSAI